MVTFRLNDALPLILIDEWKRQFRLPDGTPDKATFQVQVEKYLDAGHGSCCLREPHIAAMVQNALLHFDGQRYDLMAWVIMPNHVHTLFRVHEGYMLPGILHSWKSFTAHRIRKFHSYRKRFWQAEYFDRFIRNEKHFYAAMNYIHQNPVKAGLCMSPEEWLFSSACYRSANVLPTEENKDIAEE